MCRDRERKNSGREGMRERMNAEGEGKKEKTNAGIEGKKEKMNAGIEGKKEKMNAGIEGKKERINTWGECGRVNAGERRRKKGWMQERKEERKMNAWQGGGERVDAERRKQ
jgi:hypothetical protein